MFEKSVVVYQIFVSPTLTLPFQRGGGLDYFYRVAFKNISLGRQGEQGEKYYIKIELGISLPPFQGGIKRGKNLIQVTANHF